MNVIKQFWGLLWRPSTWTVGGVLLTIGFLIGGGGFIALNVTLAYTNTLEFCTGCHEMKTALAEMQQTKHYSNRVGIQVECPDCHVPATGLPKYLAKLAAVKDVWGSLTGVIDTPEKYEARRSEMARKVWAHMKKAGSRECFSCHAFEAMEFDEQDKTAARKHQRAMKDDSSERKTCIDCHKGVVHKLPPGIED
ncbi:MAG: trimethylamine-N-oxide reductase (cytochrome c) 1 cytochrome c-type subunit TorC [Rhodospirillaceae bacterium]|nr:MAG: trimethylamine-N-oxide reductase (cytochrome c) 1 cytochrome c-type subunit TorC [Rhodospirillaceae bacterium]